MAALIGLGDDGANPGFLKTTYTELTDTHSAILSSTQTVYDQQGRVDYEISDTGLKTRYHYDAAGRQERIVVDPDNPGSAYHTQTVYTYDNAGRQTRVTDALGRVIEHVYDDLGRVVQTIQHGDLNDRSDNLVSTTEYDSLGRQDAETDALGRRTVHDYDEAGRLTSVTLPEVTDAAGTGSTTGSATYTYGYDDYGNRTSITDPNGHVTQFTYDHLNRQVSRTLPLGVLTPGDATDFVETMHYDDTPIAMVQAGANPDASVGGGQLAYSVDFEGRVIGRKYDNTATGGGRLVEKAYFDGASALSDYLAWTGDSTNPADRKITYAYDAFGRQVEVNDSAFTATNGRTHAITYDAEGRTIQEVTPQGTINYEYNDLGQKTATYTANTRTEYGYDALGRMNSVKVTKRGGVTITENPTTYHFDLVGNLDAVEKANGVTVDYVYDAFNRLDDLYHFIDANSNLQYDSDETLIASFDYTVDKSGNRTSAVEQIDVNGDGDFADPEDVNQTFTWTYDALNRLVQETYDGVDNTLNYVTRYSFDLASNRLTAVKDTGNADPSAFTANETKTYAYDANDRLTQEVKDVAGTTTGDTNTVYAYDNTTQIGKTVREGTTVDVGSLVEDTTFTYDAMGRMVSTTVNKYAAGVLDSTITTTYAYDHNGLRVAESVDDGSTVTNKEYLFDQSNPTGYAQVLEEYINDMLTKTYTLGHDVIAQHDSTNGNLTFLYDGHGSTRALLTTLTAIADASGVKQVFTYDAYGNAVGFSVSAALTTLLYSGEWTGANGTQYLRARWYDPASGRFNRNDPFEGNYHDPVSLHKYLYTHANPIMGIDPSGMFSIPSVLSSVSIITIVTAGLVLPGPADFIESAARSLITAYAVNLEWDITKWATDWNLADDLNSRTNNNWILAAFATGLYDSFEIGIPFTGISVNPLDMLDGALFSSTSSRVSNRGRSRFQKIRFNGGAAKFSEMVTIAGTKINPNTGKLFRDINVRLFQHPKLKRMIAVFPDHAVRRQVKITPNGYSQAGRKKDIADANRAFGKPRDYDWTEEFGEPHTWHHDTRYGVMQLVPERAHSKVGHIGGATLWYWRYEYE